MTLKARLLSFSEILARKGLQEEAELAKKVAHYVPEEGTGLPSFWRRNYDYGEGFYGDMGERSSIKDWLKKKKPKEKKALDIVFLLKRASGDPELRRLYEEEADLRTEFDLTKEPSQDLQSRLDKVQNDILARTMSTSKPETSKENQLASQIREVKQELSQAEEQGNEDLVQSLEEVLALLQDDISKTQKQSDLPIHKEVFEQAQRLVNPESLVDYFRIALLKENFEEAAKIYKSMLPSEQEEAKEISQQYHRAVCINRMFRKGSKKIASFVTPLIKTALRFKPMTSPSGQNFYVVYTNHFEKEAQNEGSDFNSACMESKLGQMFDGITPFPEVWGSRFGKSFVYYTKKYNDKSYRQRWELELHSCTPAHRFRTQNKPDTKYLEVGC